MIIRIHRWQERQNRFHVQKIFLEDSIDVQGENFFGAIFDARQGMIPGFKNFRTQKVDRIEINSLDGSISVYTSAAVERKENKRSRKVDTAAAMKVYEPLNDTVNSIMGSTLPPLSNSKVLECTHDPNSCNLPWCEHPDCNT